MSIVTGTAGDDRLVGTAAADTLFSLSGNDTLIGKAGADTYALDFQSAPLSPTRHFIVNETSRGDASIDTITGLGGLMLYQLGGATEFTRITRGGPDGKHLLMTTASSPSWSNSVSSHVGYASGEIRIINQYNTDRPNAQVEELVAGGIAYALLTTGAGTAGADIMTGWTATDTLRGGDGSDYISGGGGRDHLFGDAGDDTIFGGNGNDRIYGGSGLDRLFGNAHRDRLWGGDGDDTLDGGSGNDILRGGSGDDTVIGGSGNDRLLGGQGSYTLVGGAGNDTLEGGDGRDVYSFDTTIAQHDVIRENGDAPGATLSGWSNLDRDVVEVLGFSSYDEAIHHIGIDVSGDDLTVTFTNPAIASGDSSTITIAGQFADARKAVDLMSFGSAGGLAAYEGTQAHHIAQLSGDNFTYSVHSYSDWGGEDIVLGTAGDDEIYGGLANDILVGLGGADVFMYHNEEGNNPGQDIILDFNTADDLIDVTEVGTLGFANLTVSQNDWGNAVISSGFFDIELAGVTAAEVTADLFVFA